MLKLSALPSGSEAVGWNDQAMPSRPVVAGLPLMTGARLAGSTVMVNAASVADSEPSDTEIWMFE